MPELRLKKIKESYSCPNCGESILEKGHTSSSPQTLFGAIFISCPKMPKDNLLVASTKSKHDCDETCSSCERCYIKYGDTTCDQICEHSSELDKPSNRGESRG